MPRRCPLWVVLLAAALHAFGIARSSLPAQDGLKFLRVARQFHSEPWLDVVRGSDQHPLYPAAISAFEPVLAALKGSGPDTWRLAGQMVSAIASLWLLFPLYSLTRSVFDDHPTAVLASLLWVLLPIPAEVGHDTLADSLALLGTVSALCFGERALRTGRLIPAIGCAIASGLGYLARPEVALVPVTVAIFELGRVSVSRVISQQKEAQLTGAFSPGLARFAVPVVGFLAIVGSYALVKGEVSEKLSIRWGAGLKSPHDASRSSIHPLPDGLNEAGWDFSPKEESTHEGHLSLPKAAKRVANGWIEAMGWAFAVFAIWGAVRGVAGPGKWFLAFYIAIYSAILIRHASTLGYASTRHTLPIAAATLPWAAAGALLCGRRLARLARLDAVWTRRAAGVLLVALLALGIGSQIKKTPHDGRWGFGAAGRWLAEHAEPGDAVLDTRGWARFVSGCPGYDYWHVRQALTDARLSYVVVSAQELRAASGRARTLRAVLSYAGQQVVAFPGRKGEASADVLVFRFRRPESWEGLRP